MERMDCSDVGFSQLRIHYFMGKGTVSGIGRNRKNGYMHLAKTDIGEIELSRWQAMAQELISRYQEDELQERLFEWNKEHNYTNDADKLLRLRSLEDHIARLFDDPLWVDYVPFNQRYRLDILDDANLVWVKTVCCEEPGLTTQEQIDSARGTEGSRTVHCPCCGRWSAFKIVDAPQQNSEIQFT